MADRRWRSSAISIGTTCSAPRGNHIEGIAELVDKHERQLLVRRAVAALEIIDAVRERDREAITAR